MSAYAYTRSDSSSVNTPVTQQIETGNANSYAGLTVSGGDLSITDGGAVQGAFDLSRKVIEEQRNQARQLAALADGALKSAINSNQGITREAISGIRAAAGDTAMRNSGDTAATLQTAVKWGGGLAALALLVHLVK